MIVQKFRRLLDLRHQYVKQPDGELSMTKEQHEQLLKLLLPFQRESPFIWDGVKIKII